MASAPKVSLRLRLLTKEHTMTQEILNLYGFHVHIDVLLLLAVVNSPAFKLALNMADEARLSRVVDDLKWDWTSNATRIDAIEQRIAHLQAVTAEVERLTA